MSKSWGDNVIALRPDEFTDPELARESVDDAAPPPEPCPCCGDELDTRWPMPVDRPGFDPHKEWVRCSNCGAWVEQV